MSFKITNYFTGHYMEHLKEDYMERLTEDDLQEISRICTSEIETMLINLRTISQLMSAANEAEKGWLEPETLTYTGFLVQEMAEDAQAMLLLKSNADYRLSNSGSNKK